MLLGFLEQLRRLAPRIQSSDCCMDSREILAPYNRGKKGVKRAYQQEREPVSKESWATAYYLVPLWEGLQPTPEFLWGLS